MKFGLTLRKHSKAEWRCMDYAFLKRIIQELASARRVECTIRAPPPRAAPSADGTLAALDHSLALVRLLGEEIGEWKRRLSGVAAAASRRVAPSSGSSAAAAQAHRWGAPQIRALNHQLIESVLSMDASSIAHGAGLAAYTATQLVAQRRGVARAAATNPDASSDGGSDMSDDGGSAARSLISETPVPFISQLTKEIKAANAYFRGLVDQLRRASLRTDGDGSSSSQLLTTSEAITFGEKMHDLKNFAVLNVLATLKIVKKHDKVLDWRRPLGLLVQRRLYGADFFHFLCAAASAEQAQANGAGQGDDDDVGKLSDTAAVRGAEAPLAETHRYLLRRAAQAERLLAKARVSPASPSRRTISESITSMTTSAASAAAGPRTDDADALAADPMNYLITKVLRRGGGRNARGHSGGGAASAQAQPPLSMAQPHPHPHPQHQHQLQPQPQLQLQPGQPLRDAGSGGHGLCRGRSSASANLLSPGGGQLRAKRPRLNSTDLINLPQFDLATLSVAAAGGNTADRLAAAVAEHTGAVDGTDNFGGLFGVGFNVGGSWLDFDQTSTWTGSDGELTDGGGVPLPIRASQASLKRARSPAAAAAVAVPAAAAPAPVHTVKLVRMKRSNFGSIRCGKCNSFGLVQQCTAPGCRGAKYYIVCRVARVPKSERIEIARVAYANWTSANEARIALKNRFGAPKRRARRSKAGS